MHSPRLFYIGTVMFITGSLLTFVSFGFAAQSLLASLEGVQFVSNVFFARFIRGRWDFDNGNTAPMPAPCVRTTTTAHSFSFLLTRCRRENWRASNSYFKNIFKAFSSSLLPSPFYASPVTLSVVVGVAMIVGGVVTVVLNGSHGSVSYSVPHLMDLYATNQAYLVFLIFAGGGAVVLRYTERAYSKRQRQGRPWSGSETIIPVTYAAFSAIFGTQSVVQAKGLMMALQLTLAGNNQFKHPFVWAMLGWWAVCSYVWLARMGKALRRFDPMFIIPLLQVGLILLAIISQP